MSGLAYADENVISVFTNKEIGKVNKKVFGSNLVGDEPSRTAPSLRLSYAHIDYGAGIWNPRKNEYVEEVVNLAKEAGLSIFRFATMNHNEWKKSIGNNREHFLFGLDEFMKTVHAIGAEPFITISYFTGNEQDAADLVEYLNVESDGKHFWADKRAENGHPEPYGVKYFELGNEVWKGNYRNIKEVRPEKYGERYLSYQKAIKKVDSSIQLGLMLKHPYDELWDGRILGVVGSNVDFIVKHIYPTHDMRLYKPWQGLKMKDMFQVVLGSPSVFTEKYLLETLRLIKAKTGRDDIYFAVNEFNGWFIQNEPVPYRHSLGNALVIAELLKIFTKPSNKILMANNWNFLSSYWGSIKSEGNFMTRDYRRLVKYTKRPNYYVYELYNKHFGDILVKTDVKSDSYDMRNYKPYMKALNTTIKGNANNNSGLLDKARAMIKEERLEDDLHLDTVVPYLSVNASKSREGDKLYLMVINKNMDETVESFIKLVDFNPLQKADVWILNGPSPDATNEYKKDNVRVEHKKIILKDSAFRFVFEPHSLTAIEIRQRSTDKTISVN
ncbi:intracellular exo-alpha-L-arabinofuranosidase 2 [bacterium BMS3Abin15]|nr:intracellular exo-alpha-L-arabinofuranosidase 2 [bacterium BMS3Abin15]